MDTAPYTLKVWVLPQRFLWFIQQTLSLKQAVAQLLRSMIRTTPRTIDAVPAYVLLVIFSKSPKKNAAMEIDKSGGAPRIAMTRETSPKEMAENRKNKVTARVIPARRKNPNALVEQTSRIFFGNIL